MARANEKVLDMVRREIEKDPHVTNKVLLANAKRIDRSVGGLSPQQFQGVYRLRVTREIAAACKPWKSGRKAAARTPAESQAHTIDRDALRAVLLELAADVAAAAGKAAVIRVVGSLDRYVDRVVVTLAQTG